VAGLDIVCLTYQENMDTRTVPNATVRVNEEVVANSVQIAKGELREFTESPSAYVSFAHQVNDTDPLTVELTHPGIDSNKWPHWRMGVRVNARVDPNGLRVCRVTARRSPAPTRPAPPERPLPGSGSARSGGAPPPSRPPPIRLPAPDCPARVTPSAVHSPSGSREGRGSPSDCRRSGT
jgi:hypothetical protein